MTSRERLLWQIEDAVKEYGRMEYDAGSQAGAEEHQRYLNGASRAYDHLHNLIVTALYGPLPTSEATYRRSPEVLPITDLEF